MTDTPPVSFVPARQDPRPNGQDPAPVPVPAQPYAAASSLGSEAFTDVHSAPTLQRAPLAAAPGQQAPVLRPSLAGLPTDKVSGFRYRPLVLGGVEIRCASKVPADVMLEVVAAQQKLSDKNPEDLTGAEQLEMLHLLGQMLAGVVWEEDADRLRERLRDKREPVDLPELSEAIQKLWLEYNTAAGVGKDQPA